MKTQTTPITLTTILGRFQEQPQNIGLPEHVYDSVATLEDQLAETRFALKWIASRLERGGKAAASDAIAQARATIARVEGSKQ